MTFLPNLTRLRLQSNGQSTGRLGVPRPRRGEKFLKGPIPWEGIAQAARLPGHALHVYIGVWLWIGVTRSRRVALSTSWLSKHLHVDRFAAYRSLTALERAGLIAVRRQRGRHPVVTVLDQSCHSRAYIS